ncbi:GNAT family N-acetyltransferase [Vibrio sp. SCSIO 43140]|uniref:N-acetylglutamate synthase n=1 Tax=Vibrio variabilis TaxID=990271 RepID=A0ABQ0JGW9_9VIBR|nr:GNAT family N-acetyltransferase [Vibrio sp. SCSIO 43140]USD59170.1 GNAT family N-acetyltransferase [Vibrio sp. SCSIO 43140]GAL28001.1 N-acetylglutamate synthase [Vibrio variabilis]
MTIVTRRTILVPYTDYLESDFLMLNVCAKNRKHMNGPHTLATARRLFQSILSDSKFYAMAALDLRTRDYMGHIFIERGAEGEGEIGYIFDKQYWNKGIATEVLRAFIPDAVHTLGLKRLEANVDTDHASSIRLLSKLGFEQYGQAEDEHGPYYQFQSTFGVPESENSAHGSLSSPAYLDNSRHQALKTQTHK